MASRIDKLIDAWDPILKRAFRDSIFALRDRAQVNLIATMLERGDVEGALRAVSLDPVAFRAFDKSLLNAFEAGGNFTSGALPVVKLADGFKVKFQFNIRNPAAERWLSEHSSRLVTEILDDQRTMIRGFLRAGMAAGNNPRTVALDLVGRVGASGVRESGVIGLTTSQSQWLQNYSAELASDNPRAALSRSLRDKRFDRAVIKAAESGEAIPAALRAKMEDAYANRALRFRAESIARTEAMASLHEAQQQAMEQAVETGAINRTDVKFIWRATQDERTRDSHAEMDGQEVGMGEMFITGDGAQLEFPGDPNGPPEEIINCRCFREPSIDFLSGLTCEQSAAFSATVDEWVRKSNARMTAIFRESAKRTVSIAQSRIPVDTGFARASVRASLQSMPPINRGASNTKGGSVSYDGGEIILTIAGAELGQTIFIGWTANYVGMLEAGHSKQAPSGFVRIAALQWQQTVNEVVAEAKARVG